VSTHYEYKQVSKSTTTSCKIKSGTSWNISVYGYLSTIVSLLPIQEAFSSGHSMVPSEHVMIGTDLLQARLDKDREEFKRQWRTDFLQARFLKDWEEFDRQGRTVVAQRIPKRDRQLFRDRFRKLEKAGCVPDVLFPCIYIFLNSRGPRGKELKFPRKEDWAQIPAGLDRVRKKMETLTNERGIATLMDGWDLGLDLDAFFSFKILHQDFLGAMNQYIVELKTLCSVLPRKDVIRQYGQAVICTYVRSATKLSFSQTYSLTQTLLECCSVSEPGRAKLTANWARDIKRFRKAYPLFCEWARSFLIAKHHAPVTLPPPDWERFMSNGNRK
jgi:hypothetical protein